MAIHDAIENEGRTIKKLISDTGSEFTNEIFMDYCERHGIQQLFKEPGDNFSMGNMNSLFRVIRKWLKEYMEEHETLNWVDSLPIV